MKHQQLSVGQIAAFIVLLFTHSVSLAQQVAPGGLPTSVNGKIGQRQSANNAPANAKPLGRIANRLENRVASRIQTRINRDSTPQIGMWAYGQAAQQVLAPLGTVRRR